MAKPWKKGESGNPKGRPPRAKDGMSVDEAKSMLARMLPRAIEVLDELLESADEKVRMKAAELVIDRNLGKVLPAEQPKPEVAGGYTVTFTPMPNDAQ